MNLVIGDMFHVELKDGVNLVIGDMFHVELKDGVPV